MPVIIADRWAETLAAHALPVEPGPEDAVLAILQDAADRGHQRRLAALLDGAAALARLQLAFARFAAHRGPLAAHFAYGELSHDEYALAHVLHLYNHLALLRANGQPIA